MTAREPEPAKVGRTEIGWSAVVTAIGALAAFSMAQPGNEPMEAAAMVLIVLAAAQATVVVISLVREVAQGRRELERAHRPPGRDHVE